MKWKNYGKRTTRRQTNSDWSTRGLVNSPKCFL